MQTTMRLKTIKEVAVLLVVNRVDLSTIIDCNAIPTINVGRSRGVEEQQIPCLSAIVETFKARRASV